MSEKVECHVSLHYVLPPEERDVWNAQDQETKNSWRPMSGQQDPVGEATEYVALIPPDDIAEFNAARNCRYCVPAQEAHAHGDPETARILVNPFGVDTVPAEETLRYHYAGEEENCTYAGAGVVYFHLDTGASSTVISALDARYRLEGVHNFTGKGVSSDVSDNNGHGSMTLSLLLPRQGRVHVMKVLGDDGSGSSSGIVRAIRECANIASRDPSKKYILSGSLGGPPGQTFQPYADACALAEEFGVLCRWSAGNDGVNKISAPANWREDRASIAYNITSDRIAGFSNYASSGGSATHGEDIVTYDKSGRLVSVDGTSFSLPLWNRFTGIMASIFPEASIFEVNDAELAAGRDTPGSVQEEPHGVLNVARARIKLAPPAPEPPPEPEPDPAPDLPVMSLSQFESLHPNQLKILHCLVRHRTAGMLGEFKGSEVK